MLERLFKLQSRGTDAKTEIVGGLSTFTAMAYIVFVQPAVLSAAGMDAGAVMVATCLSSAAATLIMGFAANYPIALAPGMGSNFFFAYTVVLSLGYSWQEALGALFFSGLIFLALSLAGLRERVFEAVPETLRNAIAAGIGMLISLVGLQWSGLIVDHPSTLVTLGSLSSPPVIVSLAGIACGAALLALKKRAAMLWATAVSLAVALALGLAEFEGVAGPAPSLAPTFLQLDVLGALSKGMLPIVFVFLFLDLFDTAGTLIGVSRQAGLLDRRGRLPQARQAMLADASGTLIGALTGTSTVTSYIESSSGISAGARTGLANLTTAGLFLLSILFTPLVRMIGGGVPQEQGPTLYPVIAPALILVGSLMMRNAAQISWDDASEAIPAFLTILLMPLSFSITEGLSVGFISFVALKTVCGRWGELPPLTIILGCLFVARYFFLSG